ncbi:HpcH/HpaI aldolase/citrate lyase family protein [Notoacmeibacter sp. MSK16QG-6]|uniref:HpcH/HpaI aldolase family protein n=1 Tax=Notoacmeibacter sp. MSK16QG-6 TaxID=2957982 RepID=UPI0020A14C48|nr:aldolase/citrate lyase family protein [Notoacmeibacter sp. MSK16QG-6]MCP1198315.1 aldolase/citrate lyase family protein [Notoacmeibacter sp. MSK16QG-6]
MSGNERGFRERFLAQETLYGTFLKLPATMPAEILGSLGYDFIVVDEEHSPFNRETTDRIILACKAFGLAAIVRVQSGDPANILSVLDCGADGVLVPHVKDAETARAIVAAGRYSGGKRGFAPTTRAGTFGRASQAEHMAAEDRRVTIVAMIEDPEAIDNIDEIIAVDGIDGVFIGRGDLAAAYAETDDPAAMVRRATETVHAAAAKLGRTVAILPGTPEDAATQAQAGSTAFLLSSDQGFLRSAAMQAHDKMSSAVRQARKD